MRFAYKASFIQHNYIENCPCCWHISIFLVLNSISFYYYYTVFCLLILLLMDTLGYLQFEVIINKASMNIVVQIFL